MHDFQGYQNATRVSLEKNITNSVNEVFNRGGSSRKRKL